MPKFTLDEVLSTISAHAEIPGKHEAFLGIATDSRNIKGGELFFALTGPNFDGHDLLLRQPQKERVV